jgi:peptide/nickel transport system ATP-binding protein
MLSVRDLSVTYPGPVPAVRGVSLDLAAGEILGIAGESGSGKTSVAHAVLRLLPRDAEVAGEVLLGGEDVLRMTWGKLRAARWTGMAVALQSGVSALNPVQRIGKQLAEAPALHGIAAPPPGDLLERAGLPARYARAYPHQLSGGEAQRAAIAMALACSPRLLVVDEATTGLDLVTRAQILALLRSLASGGDMGILLVSHDLPMLGTVCDRLAVLYAGRVCECGPVADVLGRPSHPYTAALVSAAGVVGDPASRLRPRGLAPSSAVPSPGCAFAPRCPVVLPECSVVPPFALVRAGQVAACHRVGP